MRSIHEKAMNHMSACIVEPILGHCLEYDTGLFRVSFGSICF
jgi:hypothetical protein